MILKWLSVEGNWHLVDGVTDVVNHGWKTSKEMHDLADLYDGEDHVLSWRLDPETKAIEDQTGKYHYVVATIRGEREHMILQDCQMYVVSDQGKTVDRL